MTGINYAPRQSSLIAANVAMDPTALLVPNFDDEPIPLPKGGQLVTLKEAGTYTTKLPKTEHMAAEWQVAMEVLIFVATLGGPTMFAHIGIMRALNCHVERVVNPSRKETHWGRRRLARDR